MNNSKAEPGSLTYLSRSVAYALTSVFALYAGYFLGTKNPIFDRLLFLIIPFFASFFFFVSYAICFQIDKKERAEKGQLRDYGEREGAKNIAIIMLLLAISIFLVYWKVYGYPGNLSLINIILYLAPFMGYGFFLYKRFRNSLEIIVRHQLVLPVILSIAFPLYFGMHLEELTKSILPLWPFGVILILSIISEILKISFKIRAGFSLLLYFSLFVLSTSGIISNPYISPYLSSALFCISISAYLAVFESWGVTIGVAIREAKTISDTYKTDIAALDHTSERYYQNTLLALVISGLAIPLLYTFTPYTTWFLIVFSFHATTAFILWYAVGSSLSKMIRFRWKQWKLGLGFLFLAILVPIQA